MKKYLFLIFTFFTVAFSQNINFTSDEIQFIKNNPQINVGVETDWPPFDFVENEKYMGIAKDYLTLIEKSTGLKFNYIYGYTWDELLKLTETKEIDLLPILAKTKDREKYLLYTKPYIEIRDYVFSLNNKYSKIEDLYGKSIAVPIGYAQEQILKEKYPQINIYPVRNLLDAIDAVITKKADALISNPPIINYLTKKHSLGGITADLAVNYDTSKLHMAVRDDYVILRSIIQKALDAITILEKNKISENWISLKNNSNKLTVQELEYIQKNKSIIVANELDWIPYDYAENGEAKGYVIDYFKLISKKVGLEPIFISDSWSNLLTSFKNKEIDVLPVVSYNKKREEFLSYSKSHIKQEYSIVTKKSKIDIFNMDDLTNKKLALVKGWNSTNAIKERYPLIDVVEYDSLKDVFEAVSNNFADATIQNRLIGSYYVNKEYKTLKLVNQVTIKSFNSDLFMGIQKDANLLVNIINKAMSQVTDEEIKALELKWLNISKTIEFSSQEQEFIKNKIINVAYTDNWAPLSFVSDNKAYGLGFDFWSYIVDKANLKVNTNLESDFSNALSSIKNKTNDVIVTTSKTPDRETYSIFSKIYYKAPIGIATLKDQNYVPDATYLLDKKVAVGRNYTAHKLLKKAYPNMKFVTVNNIQEGLELLSNNKVFALVDNMPVLAHNIKKFGFSNIKISGNTGIDFDLQIMIRNDYEVLQSIINKVLNNMTPIEKESIYNKWTKLEYTTAFDYSILWKFFLPLIVIIAIVLYKNRQLVKYQKNLKNTQEQLENSLKSFKALVNLTIEGILIIKNKRIVFCNNEALKMFNLYHESELLGKDINILFKKNDEHHIEDIIGKSDSKTYELTAIKNSTVQFPTLVKSKNSYFEDDSANILSVIDMSEIKDKENLLIQQSKMASLGEMIGNIAHQWRQPLSFISTAASGMKLQKEFNQLDDKIFVETLEGINETTKFLSQTIEDFQNYLKDDKVKKEFNVNDSIEKILNIVKGSFVNHFISVKLDLSKNLILSGYENELNQALLNILNNSKDALKETHKDDRYVYIKSYENQNKIVIEIIDNAGGVPQEIIQKVFEPYFTTKHKSQGTGLGLYMTHKIINESMKGEIRISNISTIIDDKKFDKCAKVTITLPIS